MDFDSDAGSETTFGGFVTLPFDIGNLFSFKNPFAGWKEGLGIGKGPRPLRERMTDRVVRDIDIVHRTGIAKDTERVADMIFVDNSNTSGLEDGTLSHPYSSLASAFSDPRYGTGMRIYVKEGTGDATGYTGNFVLAPNTWLWGSGTSGGYNGITTTAGNPIIDGGGSGNVVTLSDNNMVMGVTIQNGYRGIYGHDVTNATIINNAIKDNAQEGIFLDLGGSTQGVYIIDSNITTNNSGMAGICLLAGGNAVVRTEITNNVASYNVFDIFTDSIPDIYFDFPFMGPGYLANAAYGVALGFVDNSIANIVVSGNSFEHNSGGGGVTVRATDNARVEKCDILLNSLKYMVGLGIDIRSALNSSMVARVSNNSVDNNVHSNGAMTGGADAVFVFHELPSQFNLSMDHNYLAHNVTGLDLFASQAGFTGSFFDNVFFDNFWGVKIGHWFLGVGSPTIIDFGGGLMNSPGNNSFNDVQDLLPVVKKFTYYPIFAFPGALGTISAQSNWWGASPPNPLFIEGDVDYSSWLTSDPNQ